MSIKSTMKAIGKSGFNYSGMGTAGKVGVGAVLAGMGIKGFYGQVAPAAIDASMDVAFGDPQADQKVLGTDLTPSMMYGKSGLPGSNAAMRYLPNNIKRRGINPGGRAALIGAPTVGAAVGGLGVAAIGKKFGLKGKGLAAASAAGAFIGGATGLAGSISNPINVARNNQQIMTQSPFYNQSALNAERLNASGNIVLGMHNQRRG
jgi:hypothetical protein